MNNINTHVQYKSCDITLNVEFLRIELIQRSDGCNGYVRCSVNSFNTYFVGHE